MAEYRLQMKGVSKSFPGVKALDDIHLNVKPGTVHALMGENGAGKSTLMKCLFGIYTMDTGEVYVDGEKTKIANPEEALHKGLAMVHQELQPVPARTIAENMYLGRYPTRKLGPVKVVDHAAMNRETKKWLAEVKMDFNPKALLQTLSISQMQTVEIAKAVSQGAKLIILDEPTSSLTENEVEGLFRIIRDLRERGVSLIYISHKMAEIREIADEITIMRDGTYVGTWDMQDISDGEIIKQMVGRELSNIYPPKDHIELGEVVLDVKNLTSINPKSFKNVSFKLRRGEIIGFGGLVGAQRSELMEAIFGLRGVESGEVCISGRQAKINCPQDAIRSGIGMITEDRRGMGILGCLSIADNVSISSLNHYLKLGIVLDHKKINTLVTDNVAKLSIKTPSNKTHIQNLSGGNQQKVIIARWLASNPDILIMDEPTRGIDVGAKYEIYQIMLKLAAQGKGIIMISSEMPELLGMSDRIMVMCNGQLTGELNKEEATQENIMHLATRF
ncbi:MAG: sugar ABC transporter ATP-binding protein [Lachnospiraceae bacterium]|nr:sugar ABC transporter ATP-binding protein [Lachnospiraceae bacterium]MDY5741985.1 sugar ABC transporter ATP-binding protein [Lachnospiraceae bacterium]